MSDRPTWDQIDSVIAEHGLKSLSLIDTAALIWNLRKDAERYRWLRERSNNNVLYGERGIKGDDTRWMLAVEALDAAIDAARREHGK